MPADSVGSGKGRENLFGIGVRSVCVQFFEDVVCSDKVGAIIGVNLGR